MRTSPSSTASVSVLVLRSELLRRVASARAVGTCLVLGCLVQGCGTPARVVGTPGGPGRAEESPTPAVEPAAAAAQRPAAPEGEHIAEVEIRYCTA